ncbi:response regulator [Isoptericola halotolerans]|uniref:histidine kinase n=1 Tax=Isoptericola halotolerans TaxID=300560 RepID=A0ABX2A722_9MICO|nr:response regulator [Isoptericola halotolerans]NOV98667.1 PAS domain S-box-containing protein [Isoptericola halotolerans]
MGEARGATARAYGAFLRWSWATGAAFLVIAVILAGPFAASLREMTSWTALVVAAILASLSCGWRAARSTGRRRRAWGALSLGGAVGLLGNVYAGVVGDPATGDIAYIAALLLGIFGLASFPTVRPRGQEVVRMLLDGVVVGGSVLYIAVFAVVLGERDFSAEPALSAYVLPVVDALLATLAVLVMTRSSAGERVPLALVGGGFVLFAVSDVSFALVSATGGFAFGSPVDLGWVGGYTAIAVAARHPAASGSPVDTRRRDGSPVLGTVVTFLLFLAAALVRVVQSGANFPWVANALWIAVLVAVVARQILVVVDNESLRHGLERRVEERTAQLRALAGERERTLESVADGIYGVDAAGLLTFVNAAGARTLGATPDDLIGRSAHGTFHAPKSDGTPFSAEGCYITEAVRDGVTTTSEQDVYRRLDGKVVPVEVTASPLRDDGVIRGAVVVFRDVTERRELERIKDEFVSVVSHELRTPLTSIRGALGLLDSGVLQETPERARRMVHIALTSSERLGRLVDDILDIERMTAGTTPLELADHAVDELVATAVEQVVILAENAGITLEHVPSDEHVRADADRIVQTLVNLLSNAVKFSPAGSTVRTSAAPVGDMIEVRVDDPGRGIPPAKLEAVFRRFEQVDASDARERGGTGLGLPIARSIVDRHGGRIWAVSDGVGTGTSVRFTLRRGGRSSARPGTARPGSAPAVRAPRPTAVQRAGADGRDRPRVVVVDDDPYVVEVLSALLEDRGYEAVGITDGRAALELVAEEHPAAIVLDLAMPGTDGAEVLAELRHAAATARVPVVVVSGTDPADARETAVLADGWLVKPVDPARLLSTVRDVIRLRPHHERILVVEDDDDLRGVVASVLEGGGLMVTQARTAGEAHEALSVVRPDLVVLDLMLPDRPGHELVEALRRDGRLQRVPIVVYSGAQLDAREREDLRRSRTVFLAKEHVAPEQLLHPVLDLLDAVAGRPGADPPDDPPSRTS